jgi:hypothetical protein
MLVLHKLRTAGFREDVFEGEDKIDTELKESRLQLQNFRGQLQRSELTLKEDWLWHGTGNTNPKEIYMGQEGFDIRFSNNGLWGTGLYFAESSRYSAEGYAYPPPDGMDNQFQSMLLNQVIVGDSYRCERCDILCKGARVKLPTAWLCLTNPLLLSRVGLNLSQEDIPRQQTARKTAEG